MKISRAGLDLIKACEGFSGTAYRDGSGVWTIAWGHTQGVRDGDRCDRAQGEAWLADDLAWAEAAVRRQMSAPASHNDLPLFGVAHSFRSPAYPTMRGSAGTG